MHKLRFPHPLTLLIFCIFIATILTYILPAGSFDRKTDEATGREVVIANTYHKVEQHPVSFFDMLVSIPKGMTDAASVIFLVFIAGGAFTVVDKTGALHTAVTWLIPKFKGKEIMIIPVISILFITGGVLENMEEEIIPLIPVLLLLTRALGYPAITAVSMSIGAAMVGASFSPLNPFQVGIAQKLASLPLLSGAGYRIIFLGIASIIWIWWTMRYAKRNRVEPENGNPELGGKMTWNMGLVLLIVLATFTIFIYGVMNLGWDFDHMSGLFFAMGLVAGLIGKLGFEKTSEAFVEGFKSIAFAGILIGFARAIFVVLEQGLIIDTIVNSLFVPVASLPASLAASGMMVVHTLLHFPVPSVSGQAVLTMPVLVPLSDLLGIARQVTVLAYQYGAGLCELITPTNGALMAMLAAAGIRYNQWMKFLWPAYLMLFGLGIIALLVAIVTGVH
jgi:uncharacterized ion transporter superfamily protein YfcC